LGGSAETVSSHRQTQPGKLSSLLRGELDWIVMKTLEKDRTRQISNDSQCEHSPGWLAK
jgi:hypothetical protein